MASQSPQFHHHKEGEEGGGWVCYYFRLLFGRVRHKRAKKRFFSPSFFLRSWPRENSVCVQTLQGKKQSLLAQFGGRKSFPPFETLHFLLILGNRGESHFYFFPFPPPILYFVGLGPRTYPENRKERRKFLCINGSPMPYPRNIGGKAMCVRGAFRFVSQQDLSLSFFSLLF